ncbi:PilZ domain-containing protein [Vibrio hannami]|uniref:PilZ domain-containing protein n=1 Tax=Vibrio hannami TaxID=2717094 RepID=UPI00240FED54|nr:PilZ domain-containing protein [Vibrio hannami]MDG3085914.1 PilZ domain-containing protein [Vibrio hannami]
MITSEAINQELVSYLSFGMKLTGTIEFASDDKREVTCLFVGLKHHQYLLFEFSIKSIDELFMRKTNGVAIVIRGFSDMGEGHVLAFRSKIIRLESSGTHLMFVEFPKQVETKSVRAFKRYSVDFKANVVIRNKLYFGKLIDISRCGCGLLIEGESIEVKQGEEIQIEPEMKHLPKPYPKCFIANCRHIRSGTVIGVTLEHKLKVSDELQLEVLQNIIL